MKIIIELTLKSIILGRCIAINSFGDQAQGKKKWEKHVKSAYISVSDVVIILLLIHLSMDIAI